jgi:uncharacterized protein YkwD
VLTLVNNERSAAGLAPLGASSVLTEYAKAQASYMASQGKMLHSAGAPPSGWSSAWGENVAKGYPSAASVVAAWMASSGHRANILSPAFTSMGLGYVASGNYWCQQFGG